MLETETDCVDDEDKSKSVTDTDDEFSESQTPRKKLQSIAISPCTSTQPNNWCKNETW